MIVFEVASSRKHIGKASLIKGDVKLEKPNPLSGTLVSWIVAIFVGVLAAALLYVLGDWRAIQAIAVGVFIALILGFLITLLATGDNAWGAIPETEAKSGEMQAAAPAPIASKSAAKKPAAKKPAAKKAAPKKAKPPVLFEKRPDHVDDLKKISGVGPKLEQILHSVGVYQFEQIANWKKADIATVDDKLKFKGRIERDEWVKQAKAFAKDPNHIPKK